MPASKHRRKGKNRPRGMFNPPPPAPLTPDEKAADNERLAAFLRHTGRLPEEQLTEAEIGNILVSQEFAEWEREHPLPSERGSASG